MSEEISDSFSFADEHGCVKNGDLAQHETQPFEQPSIVDIHKCHNVATFFGAEGWLGPPCFGRF